MSFSRIEDEAVSKPAVARTFLILALLAAAGCVASPHYVNSPDFVPTAGVRGVVFVADGAGGYHATSQALRQVAREASIPVHIETVRWSHGYGRVAADLFDRSHLQDEGHELAQRVAEFRRAYPGMAVYLVGHSAGCLIVLEAGAELPPDSVDGMVLLLPAVAADYDLRPALRSSRGGIDAFYSRRDWFYLGAATSVVGTPDGAWGADTAGRIGFRPVVQTPDDALLVGRLRQHPWAACVAWTGNRGGHYDTYQPNFLRAYVLPLLTSRSW